MPAYVIITMIVAVLAVVITIEVISVNRLPQKLIFRCDVNMELTEPGEIATLSYRIRNSSILPVMSAGVSFLLNDAVEVREDEEWIRRHGYEKTENYLGRMFTVDFFLMPHRIYEGKVKISFKHRGHHEHRHGLLRCGRRSVHADLFFDHRKKRLAHRLPDLRCLYAGPVPACSFI